MKSIYDGLRLCQAGDAYSAEHIWRNLVRAYAGVESEKRWVDLAGLGLAELKNKVPLAESRTEAIRQAIERANQMRSTGKQQEASELLQGLAELYKDDEAALELLKSALMQSQK